jgi:hypothetical protein|eukprot:COSAG02_NODE_5508_length_4271_cov_1.557047_1_plen_149_part_00
MSLLACLVARAAIAVPPAPPLTAAWANDEVNGHGPAADNDVWVQPAPECHRVTAFGALGDGEHDDTVAFQQAADAADAEGGGCVRVPSAVRGGGFVLTSTVTLAAGVKLVGDASGFPEVPHQYGPPGDLNTTGGSRILARITTPRAPL